MKIRCVTAVRLASGGLAEDVPVGPLCEKSVSQTGPGTGMGKDGARRAHDHAPGMLHLAVIPRFAQYDRSSIIELKMRTQGGACVFYKIDDFVGEWKSEAAGTQKILDALTDESLAQEVAPGYRSLGRLAWHLVGTYGEMLPRTGLTFHGPTDHDPVPQTARAIADAYRQVGEAMIAAVQSQWKDDALAETRDMYGEEWKNGATLRMLIQHEVHHRGQMTVLMRQAGVQVPGVYGPSKEEWAGFGMQAPEV